jgi:hypothetical protein
VDIWGVCSMGVGPEFAPRSHTLQILFYIQFNLTGVLKCLLFKSKSLLL